MGAIDVVNLGSGQVGRLEVSGGISTLLNFLAQGGSPNSDLVIQLRPQGSGQVVVDMHGPTAKFQMNGVDMLSLSGGLYGAALNGTLTADILVVSTSILTFTEVVSGSFATGAGSTLGFFGHAVVSRPAAYTPTNVTPDRSYDANATSIDELADVLGTLIADLQNYGLLQ